MKTIRSPKTSHQATLSASGSWWNRQKLRTKATLLAIALGTLPVAATGTLSYFATAPALKQEAIAKQEAKLDKAASLVSSFMLERYSNIQILSNLSIFADPTGTVNISKTQKQNILDKYVKIYGVYSNIAELSLEGNVRMQSTGRSLSNQKTQSYFKKVLTTQKTFISQPDYSDTTGEPVIYLADPVFDVKTGKMISIVRLEMPLKYLSNVFNEIENKKTTKQISGYNRNEIFLTESSGQYFVVNDINKFAKLAQNDFPFLLNLKKDKKRGTVIYTNPTDKLEEVVSYSPIIQPKGLPALDWNFLIAIETKEAFATLNDLRLSTILGTAMAAILVGAIAAYLAHRATRPIIESAEAVKKIGQGDFDTRLNVVGQDEMGALGSNINLMAEQIKDYQAQQQETLARQEAEARRDKLLAGVAQAREPKELEAPLNALLSELRADMNVDRVVVYRFRPDWGGAVIGESVLPNFPIALASVVEDACIPEAVLEDYRNGRIVPMRDVFNACFHSDHMQLMERLQIKANLVVPILQGRELFGLLVAHDCTAIHDWQESEIEYLKKAAIQLGSVLGGLALYEQKQFEAEQAQARNTALQMELLTLLQDVEGASSGDLTVRADVSAGEIGIVADFFNAIVESLRDIVSQVKESAGQVNTSVGSNEMVMGQLADQAQSQAHKITDTLKSVELMALSIEQVAENARQASKVSGLASRTAESGGKTIDRTVASILQLRDTVAETAKKVKRLGESSQQISKVVSLINQIALQTNLLAINASIEAARAGEEGRGFAVVAEEVGALAAQSAAATKEIEGIVDAIQRETSEVVDAMENGTTQVVEGTRQVNEAKESLNQIVKVSREIDDLLKSISIATVSQTETSQVVKLLMEQITESSEQTSTTSRQVSSSLQETVAIAQQLQASVGTFKLEEK